MSIHELLSKIPADEIRVQFFHECDIDIQGGKRGQNRVSFYTGELTPYHVGTNTGPVGVVVWISRERWNEIVKQQRWNEIVKQQKGAAS